MPLARDIDVSDGLIIDFGRTTQKKLFKITLVNKGKRHLKIKQIRSYSQSVAVVSFEKNHTIESGGQIEYLFEAERPSTNSTEEEGKIRFSFNNRMHVTRTFKLVKSEPIKKEIQEKRKIKSVVEKAKAPTPKRGLLHVDRTDDSWVQEFRREHVKSIEVTDNLSIKFDRIDRDVKSCIVFIQNNTWKAIRLESIRCDLKSVKVREGNISVGEGSIIEPNEEVFIYLDAEYVKCRYDGVAKVYFKFENMRQPIIRSIDIFYRERGPVIEKSLYDPPIDLIEMIYYEKQMSTSAVLTKLDDWVPSISENYTKHFHSTLYLEEIGLGKELKETYNQRRALFGDKQWINKNGSKVEQRFGHGIYYLEVNDHSETRPSLQVGDQLIVRKHSAPNVRYEGFIKELKDDDLILIKFGDDFVETFNNMPYYVEFLYSSSYFRQQHYAIDLAFEMYGTKILLPTEISLRGVPLWKNESNKPIRWINNNLNSCQKQAVRQIIGGDLLNPYLIIGPPGTGKTTTLVEIILQVLGKVKGSKILITTQSNSAANLITQRLIQSNKVKSGDLLRLISYKYSNQCVSIPADIEKYCKTFEDLIEGGKEVNFFKKLETVLKFRVVIATFSTVAKLLQADSLRNHFTHSVIDEAGQCTEPDVLVPMVLIGKNGQTIMAGDPMQMPPLVINQHANSRGLSESMLSRLIKCYENFNNDAGHEKIFGPKLISKLIHNYRSLKSILDYTNKQFYKGELIPMIDAKTSHEAKLLWHLNECLNSIFPDSRGTYGNYFINVTSGRNEKAKKSWYNVEEVKVTKTIMDILMKAGLNQKDIGIITPYALQVKALKKCHDQNPDIRIGTVEDFQGLERKVILVSTVRTSSDEIAIDVQKHLGFVKCEKRINVAMSRARVMAIVIGRARLLSHDENWGALIDGCKENNTYIDYVNLENKSH